MSKIYDVEKMYGQDFSIVTTNAPSNIVKQAKKLLPNTFLISSPQDESGEDSDNNMPAMFVTDYNAQPLQLTYPLYMKNGLNYSNEYGYAFINIDNSTIKTENLDGSGNLRVETNNLSNATFSKKGVVKLSNVSTDINRNLKDEYNLQDAISGKYNNSTFITVNNDGVLYLNNDLLDLINHLVDLKIKQKIDSIKIMLNSNLKMWIEIIAINGSTYSNNIHNVGSLTDVVTINDSIATSLTFNLHYLSFNYESETVQIIDSSNKVYSIEFENDEHNTIVEQVPDNDELYQHTLNNISVIFLPNYFIENNENYKQEISLVFEIDNDKSETLIFQQNKLSGYNIEITTNSGEELVINEILNTNILNGITENINLSGFGKVKYENNQIVKYQIDTFIVNNSDESNNYELLLIDDFNIDNQSISINNKLDDGEVKSKLYTFIDGIIDKGDSDDEEEQSDDNSQNKYEINTDKLIQNNDQEFLISDFIEQRVIEGEIKYYINLGTDFRIITDKNQEIGNYYKKIQIPLNIDKKTIYGYIFIINSDISNYSDDNDAPKHVYYLKRGQSNDGDQRIYVNRESDYTNTTGSFKINTLNLYCIYNDNDMLDASNQLFIPYQSFKQYDTSGEINDFNESQISCTGNNDITTQIDSNSKKLNITINNVTNNILKMLYEGLVFNINYNQSGESSIIKSQNVELKFNMLELLLTNIEFGYVDTNNWYRESGIYTPSNILNTINYNSSDYYGMNNYVLTGFNNNKIKGIKIGIPQCIQKLLSDMNNKLYINLYFYTSVNNSPSIELKTITINKQNNGKITGQVDTNDIFTILNIDDPNDSNINQIIINPINTYLPKFLIIEYALCDREAKSCYLQNTYSCDGGDITQINNEKLKKQLQTVSYSGQSILYDIINVSNTDQDTNGIIQSSTIIKQLLNNDSSILSTNIIVSSLDLSGISLLFNPENGTFPSDTSAFYMLIDNNKKYYEADFGKTYSPKFKYPYLSNINGILNKYNTYSQTLIDGQDKITSCNYQIRFNNILFKLNDDNYDNNLGLYKMNNSINDTYVAKQEDLITIYHFGSSTNNTISNFKSVLNTVFTLIVNDEGSEDPDLFDKISLENLDQNATYIDCNNNYRLILNECSRHGTTFRNLLLGYQVLYKHLYWNGLNGEDTIKIQNEQDLNISSGDIVIDKTNNSLPIRFKLQDDTSNTLLTWNDIKDYIHGLYGNNGQLPESLTYNVYAIINNGSIQVPQKKLNIIFDINNQYNTLDTNDLYFVNSSNIKYENNLINISLQGNNVSLDNELFALVYNTDHISGITDIKINDNGDGSTWPIEVKDTTSIQISNITYNRISYKLRSGWVSGNYEIQCKAVGKQVNENGNIVTYIDKTYFGTLKLNYNAPTTNHEFYFMGPSQKITSLPVEDPQNYLQYLHFSNDFDVNQNWNTIIYTVEVISYDSSISGINEDILRGAISTQASDISFVSGHQHITIDENKVQGMGEIKYRITAKLPAYGNYTETSDSTILVIEIPTSSNPDPDTNQD